MRRPLLAVAALAVAASAWAAVSASNGKLVEINQYDPDITASYVNASQCAGGAVSLEWRNDAFSGGGDYRLFVSSAVPSGTDTSPTAYCAESNTAGTSGSPDIKAATIGSVPATSAVQQKLDVTGKAIVEAAGKGCTENEVVYVCAHWVTGGTRRANSWGRFVVQVNAPSAPSIQSVGSGDGKLRVAFDAGSGGATVDRFVAEAYAPGHAPATHAPDHTATVDASPATITGLANGTAYTVYVTAYSKGGNPARSSSSATGIPAPSADFWDVCKATGCPEQGGCGSGPAGALSLIAAALLLALRRRHP